MAIDKIFNDANVDGIADNIFGAVNNSVSEVKQMQQRKAAENVQMVVEAFKKIETNITEKFDNVTDVIEKRVLTIKDGRDGSNGSDGRNGRDGKPGRDGVNGKQGTPGTPGKDGTDGVDGVSVTNANIDFDGSLVISLSSGQQINVGEVVAPDLAEKIKIVSTMSTNGAVGIKDEGSSISTGVKNINFVGATVTATASGDDVTVNVSAGTGTVQSVAATVPAFLSVAGSPITTTGTLAISLSGTALPVANGGTGITSLGTGVATALGVNTGTAGAFVVNGGALGTPSSGTVTNLTGTASININGTVGATTASSGAFTTVTATGSIQGQATNAFKTNSNSGQYYHFDNATGNNFIGLSSTNTVQLYAGSALSSTFTSTGLAVTGTLSATGVTTLSDDLIVNNAGGVATFNSTNSNGNKIILQDASVTVGYVGATGTGAFLADSAALIRVLTTTSGAQVTGTLSATGTLSGGTSGTAYSFSGSAPATSLTLNSSGNLGLGVTPSAWGAGTSVIQLATAGSAGAVSSSGTLSLANNGFFNGTNWIYNNTSSALLYQLISNEHRWSIAPSGTAGNAITFTQAMTLDASGNLGIGTTSPAGKLTVDPGNGSGTRIDGLYLPKNLTAQANYVAWQQGANGWRLGIAYNDGNYPLVFYYGASTPTASSPGTEIARFDTSGNLLVGTTSASGLITSVQTSTSAAGIFADASSASYTGNVLDVRTGTAAGTGFTLIAGTSNAATVFQVLGNGNVRNTNNSYGAISDAKLKENIIDATPKLDKLLQVKVRNYNLKSDQTHKQIGVIAQELEQVFPSMIEETSDKDVKGNDLGTTTKSVKYSVFVPMLIKAIQEQQALITQLTARITALETP